MSNLHEREIARAIDDGREILALDILEQLEEYSDDDILLVGEFRDLVEELIGWRDDG